MGLRSTYFSLSPQKCGIATGEHKNVQVKPQSRYYRDSLLWALGTGLMPTLNKCPVNFSPEAGTGGRGAVAICQRSTECKTVERGELPRGSRTSPYLSKMRLVELWSTWVWSFRSSWWSLQILSGRVLHWQAERLEGCSDWSPGYPDRTLAAYQMALAPCYWR